MIALKRDLVFLFSFRRSENSIEIYEILCCEIVRDFLFITTTHSKSITKCNSRYVRTTLLSKVNTLLTVKMGQDASSLRAKEINDLSHNDETANGSTKEKTVIQNNNTKSNNETTLTSFQSVVAEPSLKTISSISDEDHDVVDDGDSTTISDYLTEDEYDDDEQEEDEEEQEEYDEEVEGQ